MPDESKDANVAPSSVKAIMPKGDVNVETPTSTYNPRNNTFIKVPQAKMCPHCGQLMAPDVTLIKHTMGYYINAQGVAVIMNDDANLIMIKGVPFGKVTEFDRETGKAKLSPYLPKAPATPASTTPPK